MATAKQIREAMLRCADKALKDEPTDIGLRARTFVARLCGALEVIGDDELEAALWKVVSNQPRPADGA